MLLRCYNTIVPKFKKSKLLLFKYRWWYDENMQLLKVPTSWLETFTFWLLVMENGVNGTLALAEALLFDCEPQQPQRKQLMLMIVIVVYYSMSCANVKKAATYRARPPLSPFQSRIIWQSLLYTTTTSTNGSASLWHSTCESDVTCGPYLGHHCPFYYGPFWHRIKMMLSATIPLPVFSSTTIVWLLTFDVLAFWKAFLEIFN